YSEASDGLGEAAHLLRQLGWQPVAVTRPIQNTRHRGLLILTEPTPDGPLGGDEDAIPEGDARALLHWVEEGNTLLLCGRTNTDLHEALRVHVTADSRPAGDLFTTVDLGAAGGYTEGIGRLSVGTEAGLRARSDALPLWWVGDKPGAVLLRRGAGRVLVVAD